MVHLDLDAGTSQEDQMIDQDHDRKVEYARETMKWMFGFVPEEEP